MANFHSEHRVVASAPSPDFQNSAGRLLAVLGSMNPQSNYLDAAAVSVGFVNTRAVPGNGVGPVALDYISNIAELFEEFKRDVLASSSIEELTKGIILEGVKGLHQIVYPSNLGGQPRLLQDGERAVLNMTATMLPAENSLLPDDKARLEAQIDSLQESIDSEELPHYVRVCMLEVVSLARNAFDRYSIHGAHGFKNAFKRMVGELMITILELGPDSTKKSKSIEKAVALSHDFDKTGNKLLDTQKMLEFGKPIIEKFLG